MIDEHRRFFRQLTPREKIQEEGDGEFVLMEPPMRSPIEGEEVLLSEDRQWVPPSGYRRVRALLGDAKFEALHTVLATFPHVPAPFKSESESEGEPSV